MSERASKRIKNQEMDKRVAVNRKHGSIKEQEQLEKIHREKFNFKSSIHALMDKI